MDLLTKMMTLVAKKVPFQGQKPHTHTHTHKKKQQYGWFTGPRFHYISYSTTFFMPSFKEYKVGALQMANGSTFHLSRIILTSIRIAYALD